MSLAAPSSPYRITSSLVLAARQFPRHRAAMLGFVCLVLICLAAALAPSIAPFDPVQIKLGAKLKPPSFEHWLGTDHFGRDVFSRLIWGGRTSLSVGVLVVAFAFVLGVPLGLADGEPGVPHPEPGMPAQLVIGTRPTPVLHQEQREPLLLVSVAGDLGMETLAA